MCFTEDRKKEIENKIVDKIASKIEVIHKKSDIDNHHTIKVKEESLFDFLFPKDTSIKQDKIKSGNSLVKTKSIEFKKQKLKLGSLCSMYLSSYFTLDYLLLHLHDKKNISICDFLVNLLQENFKNKACFYIPQYVSMINYHISSNHLKNYMLDMCVNQIKFAIKLYWIVFSYTEDKLESVDLENFLNSIEETIVKNRRNNKNQYMVDFKSIIKEKKTTNLMSIKTFHEQNSSFLEKLDSNVNSKKPSVDYSFCQKNESSIGNISKTNRNDYEDNSKLNI